MFTITLNILITVYLIALLFNRKYANGITTKESKTKIHITKYR